MAASRRNKCDDVNIDESILPRGDDSVPGRPGNDDDTGLPGDEAIQIEAEAAIREIAFAVEYVERSRVLPGNLQLVYLNLTTREREDYCVELCLQGFRVRDVRLNYRVRVMFLSVAM